MILFGKHVVGTVHCYSLSLMQRCKHEAVSWHYRHPHGCIRQYAPWVEHSRGLLIFCWMNEWMNGRGERLWLRACILNWMSPTREQELVEGVLDISMICGPLKDHITGAPGWLCRLNFWLLTSSQVVISGSSGLCPQRGWRVSSSVPRELSLALSSLK